MEKDLQLVACSNGETVVIEIESYTMYVRICVIYVWQCVWVWSGWLRYKWAM